MSKSNSELTITLELSPDVLIMLNCLCAFYGKDHRQLIEMALEQLTMDSKLITETIEARIRTERAKKKKEG